MHGYDEEIAQVGKRLVIQLAILIRTSLIHNPGNVAFDQPVEKVYNTLLALFSNLSEVELNLEGDFLFLGDTRLKIDIDGFNNLMYLVDEMKKREIGSIIFSRGIKREEIVKFSTIFSSFDFEHPEPFKQFRSELSGAHIENPIVELYEEKKENEELYDIFKDKKELAKKTYVTTVGAVSEVMSSLKLRQAVSLKRSKRVVQSMVDLILQEDSTLLGLTNLRSHDEYTYNHSVNVCILALAIGQRLGYRKMSLSELGMAALFHDLGKFDIPLEILNKPSEFTPEEWAIMQKHPIMSVKELVSLKGIHEMATKVAIGAFEHHLNYDLSGYPKLATKRKLSLVGRIVSIVDCYDALTSSRVYNRIPFPPDKALRFMLSRSGKAFDPVLMKLFVNAIGVYPIGTLAVLNTKEIGVIIASNPNPEKGDCPRVRVIMDASGNEVPEKFVDLTEEDRLGRPRYEIVNVINATKYKIDVGKYFL
ncbi:MAG: HD-GYP domain-containing protein [Nitrospiria bacterium]